MNYPQNAVSIHPYFKVHPGKLEDFKSLCRRFVERASSEQKCLYYEFTVNGTEVFCRESYIGAEGALAHLDNVGDLLDEALKLADLARLEFHGPAAELEKLRARCGPLNPAWFILECGVKR
jgi:quinol monooxygenase YgiN